MKSNFPRCAFWAVVFCCWFGWKPAAGQQPATTHSPPKMADGQPVYKMVGETTLLHPDILFDAKTRKVLSQPSRASQAAKQKAEEAKVDLGAAISIIRQNGGISPQVQQAVAALKKSEIEIAELQTLAQQIEAERVARTVEAGEQNAIANQYFAKLKEVEQRSVELQEQAATLEAREHFFSTGFYASLAAIGMGLLGFFLQLPTVLLDRKLKQLELIKLEREISAKPGKPKTLPIKRTAA